MKTISKPKIAKVININTMLTKKQIEIIKHTLKNIKSF